MMLCDTKDSVSFNKILIQGGPPVRQVLARQSSPIPKGWDRIEKTAIKIFYVAFKLDEQGRVLIAIKRYKDILMQIHMNA